MATLFPNGIEIPANKLEAVAEAYGIVQEEGETASESFIRLKQQILWELKRKVIQHRKKKVAEETVVDETYFSEL